MNGIRLKIVKTIVMTTVFFWVLISSVLAEPITNSKSVKVEYVDNTKGVVVINDQELRFRLNTKIYDSNKRKLNRYALKVGQLVKHNVSYENNAYYVDSILIMVKP